MTGPPIKSAWAKAEAEQEALMKQQADVEKRIQRALSRDKVILFNRLTSVAALSHAGQRR